MKTQCEEIEKLLFLKAEELSAFEKDKLQDHLEKCENCRNEYERNMDLLGKSNFKSPAFNTGFLENRIIKTLEQRQLPKSIGKAAPGRRQFLKALAVASVFFFIIFSVEQVNTVKKITRLEQKLAGSNGNTINQKGQVLVLNHFYNMDDLKQIINPDLLDQGNKNVFSPKPVPGSLYLNLFDKRGHNLLKELLESQHFGTAIFSGKFYGNSQLLNLTNE